MKVWLHLILLLLLPISAAEAASSDGTTITAPNGSLTAADNSVWTWGSAAPQSGQYYILRNGISADGGYAAVMEVANSGQIYAENTDLGSWFEWNGSNWPSSSAPGAPIPPPSSSNPVQLGNGSLPATLGPWYELTASNTTVNSYTLPVCPQVNTYWDVVSGHLQLTVPSGGWYNLPGNNALIELSTFGTATATTFCDAQGNWHIGWGGGPPS
jgi:hypothetical protein